MNLTIQQKNSALIACLYQPKFTTNDVMNALLRAGVPSAQVESEAIDLTQEWHDKDLIRQVATGVWKRKPK